jgi:hypothetical protein
LLKRVKKRLLGLISSRVTELLACGPSVPEIPSYEQADATCFSRRIKNWVKRGICG